MTENWTWDEDSSTWFYGAKANGCGVFSIGENEWHGNAVHGGQLVFIGPYKTKEETQKQCLEQLALLIAQG